MDLKDAQSFNAPAFIYTHNLKNEQGQTINFKQHKFLVEPYMDNSPQLVVRKSSQVGFSTLAIIRALHLARFEEANIIYTLPSSQAVKDFVTPKVDSLIDHNPILKSFVGFKDTTALKKIGNSHVFFRGTWDRSQAISLTAQILIQDEVDFSRPSVLGDYESRLHSAKLHRPDLGWVWKFSNPSVPNKGVDQWWQKSDQKHWHIRCSRCNKWQFLDWPESIDVNKQIYICRYCKRELSHEDRSYGRWVKKRLGVEVSGYWMSRLMCPWVSAKEIIAESQKDPSFFHNFTLGKPYVSAEDSITRQSIIKNIVLTVNPEVDVAMGVDVGREKHYVIGNKYGIFKIGVTEDWDEIENMKLRYNAKMVIDGEPHQAKARTLAQKYRGDVFVSYYKENAKEFEIVTWPNSTSKNPEASLIVHSDRTKLLDMVAQELNHGLILFNLNESQIDQWSYPAHFENCYRTIEEDRKGISRAVWRHIEGRPDHFFHATAYWRVAMMRVLSSGEISRPESKQGDPFHVGEAGTTVDTDQLITEALTDRGGRSWKSI